jgi:hypothetical protein
LHITLPPPHFHPLRLHDLNVPSSNRPYHRFTPLSAA